MKLDRLALPVAVVVLACIGLLALVPAFLMPQGLYELVYGWRYPKVRDCGDAILTDAGPGAAGDRYVADYGYLSLGVRTAKTLELCALPREWMALGLDVELPGKDRLEIEVEQFRESKLRDVEVSVSVSVADPNGRTVLTQDGPLGDWIWSYGYLSSAFVYADDTMFVPKPRQKYELRISVSPSDDSADARARLVVRGGGWKGPSPPSNREIETFRDCDRLRPACSEP